MHAEQCHIYSIWVSTIKLGFYRAMHYSAKHGLAIAWRLSIRLSVRLSVTLVDQDHIGWKSWKLIAWTISPTSSLFVAQRSSTYFQGNMEKFLGRLEVWSEKAACWSTKAAISLNLKRVKLEEKLLWRAYRKSPTLFWMVPSATPATSSSPRLGFTTPTKTPIAIISGMAKAMHFKFSMHIQKLSGITRSSLR